MEEATAVHGFVFCFCGGYATCIFYLSTTIGLRAIRAYVEKNVILQRFMHALSNIELDS